MASLEPNFTPSNKHSEGCLLLQVLLDTEGIDAYDQVSSPLLYRTSQELQEDKQGDDGPS